MSGDATASPPGTLSSLAWALSALLAVLTPNAMLTGHGGPDDRSVFAYIGWLMHRGYRPYLDAWDHKGPLLYWLNWLGWSLTPHSTAGIGLLQAVVTFAAFACLFAVLRQLASVGPLVITGLFALTLLAQSGEGGNMAETWALLPLAAVHLVVFASAQRGWRWLDGLVLSASFAACFAIRPNLCLEPALAILVALHFVRLKSGFTVALSALLTTGVLTAGLIALLVAPVWPSGAGDAFLHAYFGYNAAYSRFVTLREHVGALLRLLAVMRTMAVLYAAFAAWCLLFVRRRRFSLQSPYRTFLLLALPAEVFSAALSGRSFYHYLVPLLPASTVLCGLVLEWLLQRYRAANLPVKAAFAGLLAIACVLQVRKYLIFLRDVLSPHQPETVVAAYIDELTRPQDRILPIGDVGSDTIALQAQREPASRFIYQLPIVHRANADAAKDRASFLADVKKNPPAIIFSTPGPVGNLCDAGSASEQADRDASVRDGYAYGEVRNELRPFLDAKYHRVNRSEFKDACVYVRNGYQSRHGTDEDSVTAR